MSRTKKLFEQEAKDFDYIIPLIIPFYNEIQDILIESIPFERNSIIKILDLGCGTGTMAKKMKEHFPLSHITCLDFAHNMIEISKEKMQEYGDDVIFKVGDFNNIKATQEYDVVISCFALHHIENDEGKIKTYQNIYKSLQPNGVFLTADIVLGANNNIKYLNFKRWKRFIKQNFSEETIHQELLPKYQEGDNPSALHKHISWLQKTGFSDIDTIWKYFNFAIWGGCKS